MDGSFNFQADLEAADDLHVLLEFFAIKTQGLNDRIELPLKTTNGSI